MKLCFYYFSYEMSKNIYSLFTNTSNKGKKGKKDFVMLRYL